MMIVIREMSQGCGDNSDGGRGDKIMMVEIALMDTMLMMTIKILVSYFEDVEYKNTFILFF